MPELKVYKASAGSGKTYKLTGEYIDILFRNPGNYKNILAVTFTNKASAEMKSRVIEQLYNMSLGNPIGYSSHLKEKFNLDDEALKKKSAHCLDLILHDFSKFSIETIDSFFQKIIMSFIREIGLQTGYKVELDVNNVLQHATDELLFEIDKDKQLQQWLISYAESKIEDGKSWNVKDDIMNLGKELFKENFKLSRKVLLDKISDKNFLKNYITGLIQYQKKIVQKLSDIGVSALKIMKNNGIAPNNFLQGLRGIGGFFEKLANGIIPDSLNTYVLNCINNEEAWSSKSSSDKNKIISAVRFGLMDILNKIVQIYENEIPSYNTINIIISNLPVLGIITDLSKQIGKYTDENNSFLISDTSEFLYQITGNNDSPFIYEKTGNYYKYYMIDEFQDTSRLQWHNFKPLILNSLAENHDALLVGDVKQSIYRWRNSDWKILAEEVNNVFQQFGFKEIYLNENWRSAANIVNFNNCIFKSMVECLQEQYNDQLSNDHELQTEKIKNVYSKTEQKIPGQKDDKTGYVRINCFLKQNFRNEAKDSMINMLKELTDAGYQQKDIAILVRNKKDGKEVADYIINYNISKEENYRFEVISNDSLFISSNPAIKVLVYSLKYIHDPNNFLNLFSLVAEYIEYSGVSENKDNYRFLSQKIDKKELLSYLPVNFKETMNIVQHLSLYEAVEYLVNYYKLFQNSGFYPYLQTFKDLILEFIQTKTANLSSFIEWWDTIGINKTITINEQQDAIKILTIHKSKGLQFRAVLIPFCNWNIDHEPGISNFLWCKPKLEPFNQLDILPVKYSQKLLNSIFHEDYIEEKLHVYIDNLNLLYVAFTRSIDILYANCEIDEKNEEKIKNISDLIINVFKNNNSSIAHLLKFWNADKSSFTYGMIKKKEKPLTDKHFVDSDYTCVPLFERFEFSRQVNDFFSFEQGTKNRIEYGKLMHLIFQAIYSRNDIDKRIYEFLYEGKISSNEADMLKEKTNFALNSVENLKWFTGEYKIRNEQEIISDNRKNYRPDRVMENDEEIIVVDYKFGNKEEEKHKIQVKQYIDLIGRINSTKKIKGFVWYVNLHKIIDVK